MEGADVPADDAPAAAYRYLIKSSLAESLKVQLFKTRGPVSPCSSAVSQSTSTDACNMGAANRANSS